jgi:hypothetical protein
MSDDNLQRVVNAFLTGERGGLSTTETALLEIVADGGSGAFAAPAYSAIVTCF